jgi:hypothetical protein
MSCRSILHLERKVVVGTPHCAYSRALVVCHVTHQKGFMISTLGKTLRQYESHTYTLQTPIQILMNDPI